MVIFHCYVSSPEGNLSTFPVFASFSNSSSEWRRMARKSLRFPAVQWFRRYKQIMTVASYMNLHMPMLLLMHIYIYIYIFYNQRISEICVTSHRPNYRYALYVMANKMAMKTWSTPHFWIYSFGPQDAFLESLAVVDFPSYLSVDSVE